MEEVRRTFSITPAAGGRPAHRGAAGASRLAKPDGRGPASRAWCFTLNNPTEEDKVALVKSFTVWSATYMIFGNEVGEECGTPHLQGYLVLKAPQRRSHLTGKWNDKAHWEIRKKTHEQARDYCKKEGSFEEWGDDLQGSTTQGRRTDLEALAQAVAESGVAAAAMANPSAFMKYHGGAQAYARLIEEQTWSTKQVDRTVQWFYGPSGVGKTRAAFDELVKYPGGLWVSSRALAPFMDGYDGEANVVVDDFRGDFTTFHDLLRILDRYPYRVNVKNGYRFWKAQRIIITSCFRPEEVYANRFEGKPEDAKQLLRRIDSIWHFRTDENGETVRAKVTNVADLHATPYHSVDGFLTPPAMTRSRAVVCGPNCSCSLPSTQELVDDLGEEFETPSGGSPPPLKRVRVGGQAFYASKAEAKKAMQAEECTCSVCRGVSTTSGSMCMRGCESENIPPPHQVSYDSEFEEE
jgi:hypothetical protein